MVNFSTVQAAVASGWAAVSQKAQQYTPAFVSTSVSALFNGAIAPAKYAASFFTSRVTAPSLSAAGVSLVAWAALGYAVKTVALPAYDGFVKGYRERIAKIAAAKATEAANAAFDGIKAAVAKLNGIEAKGDQPAVVGLVEKAKAHLRAEVQAGKEVEHAVTARSIAKDLEDQAAELAKPLNTAKLSEGKDIASLPTPEQGAALIATANGLAKDLKALVDRIAPAAK